MDYLALCTKGSVRPVSASMPSSTIKYKWKAIGVIQPHVILIANTELFNGCCILKSILQLGLVICISILSSSHFSFLSRSKIMFYDDGEIEPTLWKTDAWKFLIHFEDGYFIDSWIFWLWIFTIFSIFLNMPPFFISYQTITRLTFVCNQKMNMSVQLFTT